MSGHTAGGGMVDPLGLVLVSAMAVALGAAVSARPWGVRPLVVVLLAGQGLLHLVRTSQGVAFSWAKVVASLANDTERLVFQGKLDGLTGCHLCVERR